MRDIKGNSPLTVKTNCSEKHPTNANHVKMYFSGGHQLEYHELQKSEFGVVASVWTAAV